MHIDSFSGAVASLPKKARSEKSVLFVLKNNPSVSTWDMSEEVWLRNIIYSLEKQNFVVSIQRAYPWHRYEVTELGKRHLSGKE